MSDGQNHSGSEACNRVVILGAGFGGLYTALHLERLWKRRSSSAVEITLVSRENYFLMTPLLFEAGSGVLEPRHAVSPVRSLLKSTRFVEAEVESVDFERRVVVARHEPGDRPWELPYGHLVIALGGVTNRSLIPGSEHAQTFKTLGDAIYLRNHLIDLFERADVEADEARRREMLSLAVVGAGLVGVELIAELHEFLCNLARAYPRVRAAAGSRGETSGDARSRRKRGVMCPMRLHLIEAGPKILPELEPELGDYAANVLARRGIDIRVATPVARIHPGRLELGGANGGSEIHAHTIVLAAGVVPNPLVATFPLQKDPRGRIAVEATMRSVGDPHVWALGDCAAIPDPTGRPYPPLAQHALREARVLAENITMAIRDPSGPLKPFVYQTLGTLAALGHFSGVGRVMSVRVKGFLAWWVWRSYYLMQMPRWNRRIRIILDWTVALVFKNDIVKLDLFGDQHPLRASAASREPDRAGGREGAAAPSPSPSEAAR